MGNINKKYCKHEWDEDLDRYFDIAYIFYFLKRKCKKCGKVKIEKI